MLIYNHKKEFLGIDESYLKALGLSSLAELQNEADDFADLFVKSPGYIHNFKHVHWIDYITCNDEGVDSKAIINVKGKDYSTSIDIKTIYLVDNPSKKAYRINLPNIKALSDEQSQQISAKITQKNPPQISFDPYELDYNETESITQQRQDSAPKADYENLSLDAQIDEDENNFMPEPILEQSKEIPKQQPNQEEDIPKDEEKNSFINYVYNPITASEELGLPVDLVEEFIQDFIAQANSFKSALYESAKNRDLDSLRIRSHKLKGVAANLRIEDAFDALSKVNSLEDYEGIKANLDRLYKIINKLSNKTHLIIEESALAKDAEEEFEDEFVLSIKEDIPSTNAEDSLVPDSIELPELADDEFLNNHLATDEDISIEDEIIDEELRAFEENYNTPEILFKYDKNKIAHEMGLSIQNFNELFEDYINEAKSLCDSMLESLQKENRDACKNAAVKLSGMNENMRIHDFDDELKAIISHSDDTDFKALVQKIVSKLNIISNHIG